jgi:hypothetical protein
VSVSGDGPGCRFLQLLRRRLGSEPSMARAAFASVSYMSHDATPCSSSTPRRTDRAHTRDCPAFERLRRENRLWHSLSRRGRESGRWSSLVCRPVTSPSHCLSSKTGRSGSRAVRRTCPMTTARRWRSSLRGRCLRTSHLHCRPQRDVTRQRIRRVRSYIVANDTCDSSECVDERIGVTRRATHRPCTAVNIAGFWLLATATSCVGSLPYGKARGQAQRVHRARQCP